MDPSLIIPAGLVVGIGAFASHILSNRRVAKVRNEFVSRHVNAMTAVADAAIECLCVHHGMDVVEAQKLLMEEVHKRNPNIMGMPVAAVGNPKFLAEVRALIEKKRAEKVAKDAANDDSKK